MRVGASKKAVVGGLLVLAIGLGFWIVRDTVSLEYMATREGALRTYRDEHPALTYALAFSVYVSVTGLSLPGALVLSLAYGWFFGFWRSVLLVSFASTTGATIAFLLSRYLFRERVQSQLGGRLTKFNEQFLRDGGYFLLALRLIPAVPFFVVNALMALTSMRTWSFWWISQLGMLPGTMVYLYAASSVPSLAVLADQGAGELVSRKLLIALSLLGLFPLFVRWAFGKLMLNEVNKEEIA